MVEPYRYECGNGHVVPKLCRPNHPQNTRGEAKWSCHNDRCNWKGGKIWDKKKEKWVRSREG